MKWKSIPGPTRFIGIVADMLVAGAFMIVPVVVGSAEEPEIGSHRLYRHTGDGFVYVDRFSTERAAKDAARRQRNKQ